MNKVIIYYFTGTGNTLLLSKTMRNVIIESGYECEIIDISTIKILSISKQVTYGFAFPVYAYGMPNIMKKFLNNLPNVDNTNAFVVSTAGEGIGIGVDIATTILKKKGFNIIGSLPVLMPQNFVPIFKLYSLEQEAETIANAKISITRFIKDLVEGKSQLKKKRNFIRSFSSRIVYFIFEFLGIRFFYKLFKVDEKCNSCSYCAKICPVGNITMKNGKPEFGNHCELCMRCLNFCPQESIQVWSSKKHKRYNKLPFKFLDENSEENDDEKDNDFLFYRNR